MADACCYSNTHKKKIEDWVALPICHMEARHCADLDWKWKLIEMAAAQFTSGSTACVIPVAPIALKSSQFCNLPPGLGGGLILANSVLGMPSLASRRLGLFRPWLDG